MVTVGEDAEDGLAAVALATVAALAAGVAYATGLIGGDDPAPRDSASASPSASPSAALPAGVSCRGDGCDGKDPEASGCGGDNARTVGDTFFGGAYLEVRYSEVCGAAWARITHAPVGAALDLRVGGDKARHTEADADGEAYTAMTAVDDPAGTEACTAFPGGSAGCTNPATSG
ncbi:hypothetical protein SRB5_66170 [Streptomyces sp. RB5]|uniref:DUF2690 domain-containing protein n=1 Tax=Streptomyces smaragdinus TaxID=2585196 RepID=A0A7K0CSL5_9ACTN|nr:hypothetical protein [Streptomyces smaragdinus]